MPAVREPFVKVRHPDVQGEGEVPLAAVPIYESNGWEVVETKQLETVRDAVDKGEDPEAALTEGGETDTGTSKKTSKR